MRLVLLLLGALWILPSAVADSERDIAFILQAQHPPKGVVFEIVAGGESDLQRFLPRVHSAIERLRERHPGLRFAVVSHGTEQFGLLSSRRERLAPVHSAVRKLVSQDVPVHVCGTHAAWEGFSREDFPDYVDVAAAGPEQIRAYQRQGYALIRLD